MHNLLAVCSQLALVVNHSQNSQISLSSLVFAHQTNFCSALTRVRIRPKSEGWSDSPNGFLC
jgi:hypothetical protein